MNVRSGASGEGPATIFKDAKSIASFIHFYSHADFEIVEVELTPKGVVTFDEAQAISKAKKIKRRR